MIHIKFRISLSNIIGFALGIACLVIGGLIPMVMGVLIIAMVCNDLNDVNEGKDAFIDFDTRRE